MRTLSRAAVLASLLLLPGAVFAERALTLSQLESRYYSQGSDGLYLALKSATGGPGAQAERIASLVISNAIDLDTGIELTQRLSSNTPACRNALNRILTAPGSTGVEKILAASGLLAMKSAPARRMLSKYYRSYQGRPDRVIAFLDSYSQQWQLD